MAKKQEEKKQPNPQILMGEEKTNPKKNMDDEKPSEAKTEDNFWKKIYYDPNGIYWVWDESLFKWKKSDEIDVLNMLQDIGEDTEAPKIRTMLVNISKQKGRRNKPKDPKKTWIQFKDKIYDAQTGESFEAIPDYFITNPLPYPIGSSEETPTIDRLFQEWAVEDGVQNETYLQTLYEIIAYCCCTEQFLQRVIALTGSGSNGKGTYLNLIAKFLGRENICSSQLKTLMTRNFETSALHKRLVCFIGEVDTTDLSNTNLLKSLTGEDLIRYEYKGKTPFSEYSPTTPIIATNSLPMTPDKSIGFYRRWLIIDFPHQFKIKRDLISEIPESEFSNLSRKILRVLKELYERNEFTNAGTMEERIKKYEARSNPLISFVETSCEESPELKIKLRDFFNQFNTFLQKNRLRPITIHKLGFLLRNEGFEIAARYLDKKKTQSAKVILGLNWSLKGEESMQSIVKNGSLGSQKLPELPKPTIECMNPIQEPKNKLPKLPESTIRRENPVAEPNFEDLGIKEDLSK